MFGDVNNITDQKIIEGILHFLAEAGGGYYRSGSVIVVGPNTEDQFNGVLMHLGMFTVLEWVQEALRSLNGVPIGALKWLNSKDINKIRKLNYPALLGYITPWD